MNKLLATLMLFACPLAWPDMSKTVRAGPTWGTVVDAQTNQPLSGVLVIAIWRLETVGTGWGMTGTFNIIESVTNENGEFRMPGWGPAKAPAKELLGTFDPVVLFYKPGYSRVGRVSDGWPSFYGRAGQEDHTFSFNGDTTRLRKYTGSAEGYSIQLSSLYAHLSNVLEDSNRCSWKGIPRTVRLLDDEYARLKTSGAKIGVHAAAESLMTRSECAPFDEFLTKYQASDSR